MHALALAPDHELFGHATHTVAPAAEYVPALQGEHWVESAYVPALQVWHTAFDVALHALTEIVPASHVEHGRQAVSAEMLHVELAYWLELQLVHGTIEYEALMVYPGLYAPT